MGHIGFTKSSLVPLIDRLNKYPIGLVDNEKLREILSLLFEEREAYVASKFPLEEATLAELSSRTGIPEDDLAPILDRMADKGIVFDLPYKETTYYLLAPGLIGFFEFTFMKNRTDLPMDKLARLMHEYLHDRSENNMAKEFFGGSNQLTRALVYEDRIPVTSKITTYENAREIIKNASYGAAGLCYCRHKKHHQGKDCKRGARMESVCITLGRGAEFLVRRGFQEKKSVSELLDILDYSRSLNLTHVTDNVRDRPSFICNCCRCCCELMAGVQMGFPDGVAKTPFIAQVDPEKCDYCGECLAACNVKAMGPAKRHNGDGRYTVADEKVCLGCGACVPTCEKGAITLEPREKIITPPKNRNNLFLKILWERGKIWPFLVSRLKRKARAMKRF